jgi:hypothetical protein
LAFQAFESRFVFSFRRYARLMQGSLHKALAISFGRPDL